MDLARIVGLVAFVERLNGDDVLYLGSTLGIGEYY
jgi:hypothetical protein